MDRKDGVKHSICLETKAAYRGDAPKLFGEMIKMMEALRDHAQKWKINPTGLSADEIKAVKVPEAFAFSFMVTWMLENSTEEFREFKKAIWGTAEMGRILPMFVPSTMFLFKGVKEKGHPLDTVEQLEATIKMLQKEMDELKTKFVPLANKIKKGRKVLGKLEKKLSAHINDTAPTCFETALKERQNNLPKVQQSRPTRIQTGDMFMESFVATVSDVNDMMTREKKIDVTHDEEETFSSKPKTKTTIQNARTDIGNGISDFAVSIYEALIRNKELPERLVLELKLPIIQEFVRIIKAKHFSAFKMCKLIDTSLRHNVSSISEMRQLLNYCLKDTDLNIEDLVDNIRQRGGNHENRVNMMCSNNELLEWRRLLEAVANHLIGGTRDEGFVGAKIDVHNFMQLYLHSLYRMLDAISDFENGVCKYTLCIDITNDGSRFAGYAFNIAGLKLFCLGLPPDDPRSELFKQMAVCVVLSVFVDLDNTKNLELFHSHLYTYFQEHVINKGDCIEIQVENGRKIKFKIDIACSGDLKSHGQAVGLPGLGPTSTTNAYFCCTDCHKTTGMVPNADRCGMCKRHQPDENCPCLHEKYCRCSFVLPEDHKDLQCAMNIVKQYFEVAKVGVQQKAKEDRDTRLRNFIIQKETAEKVANIDSSSNPNAKRRKVNKDLDEECVKYNIDKDKDFPVKKVDVLADDVNKVFHMDHGNEYIAFIDISNSLASERADVIKEKAFRMSGFAKQFDNKDEALAYIRGTDRRGTKRFKEVVLFDLSKPDMYGNNPIYNKERFVGINQAEKEDMQHCILSRIVHNQHDYIAYSKKPLEINNLCIQILKNTYNYQVSKSILDQKDHIKQTKALLAVLLILERYSLFFFRDHNRKVISDSIVVDRLRLVICDLHMEMRIGLTLIQDLLNNCILCNYSADFGDAMLSDLEYYINHNVFREAHSINNSTNFSFPRDNKDRLVSQITLQNPQVVKILEKSDAIIDRILSFKEEEQKKYFRGSNSDLKSDADNYRDIFNGFKTIMKSLREFNHSHVDDDFEEWQIKTVDPWIQKYLYLFGWQHCGHYVHFLARGHVCEQLKFFKNIHMHSQQSWEGMIGKYKTFLGTHTQRGGHCKGGITTPHVQESISVSMLRFMLRNAMYTIYPSEDHLVSIVDRVKNLIPKENRGLSHIRISSTNSFKLLDPVEESLLHEIMMDTDEYESAEPMELEDTTNNL